MSLEERVRAATRAAAGTIEQIPDLTPTQTAPAARRLLALPRRWRPWLTPVAAAAAVVALATALVTVKVIPNGGGVPQSPAAVGQLHTAHRKPQVAVITRISADQHAARRRHIHPLAFGHRVTVGGGRGVPSRLLFP